jgi:hypothetical protein
LRIDQILLFKLHQSEQTAIQMSHLSGKASVAPSMFQRDLFWIPSDGVHVLMESPQSTADAKDYVALAGQ